MKHFIIISLLCFAIAGCSRSGDPSDLPKLYPCAITVTQDGKPLEGAVVEFIVSGEPAKYRATGTTDAAGVAEMNTYGKAGSPVGKYKVIVTKNVQDDLVYAESSTGTKDVVGWTLYCTVEPTYSNTKTTPHEIEITGKDKATATFDVGKAIKKRL